MFGIMKKNTVAVVLVLSFDTVAIAISMNGSDGGLSPLQ